MSQITTIKYVSLLQKYYFSIKHNSVFVFQIHNLSSKRERTFIGLVVKIDIIMIINYNHLE